MEFRETLLAAQRNQQQKSSSNSYYKARFDPPKKEHKAKDKLSANIQKFLAKKEEEEKLKKLEEKRKREELHAMRDPKALRKIQKTLKVIKSANKSVLEDAIDLDNTAVTLQGADQPDQDDYGYESQEAAAIYAKMMQKYSKIPDEPKFPVSTGRVKKDLNSTRERVKHALQHVEDPMPHKRKRKTENGVVDRDSSPPTKYEPEKKKEEKPKIRKPVPPPMDFNQLLKLAEQKKNDPLAEVVVKKVDKEIEPERLMTKKQKREYEEEMERRRRRQERIEAQKGSGKRIRDDRPADRDKKVEESLASGFGRIPKLGDKINKSDSSKPLDREKERFVKEKERFDREKERYEREKERYGREKMQKEKDRTREISEKEKSEREKLRADRERLDRLKAERDRIDREMERLNKDKERLDKTKSKLENKVVDRKPLDKLERSKLSPRGPLKPDASKSIDLKSQNTYRIDKNFNERKVPSMNGHTSGRPAQKPNVPFRDTKGVVGKPRTDGSPKLNSLRPENGKRLEKEGQAGPSKAKLTNSFNFDKHVSALKNGSRQFPPGHVKRKPQPDDGNKAKRRLESDSEHDSEMDDFIDDGDENMDYSSHIKEIFGYDKSKYRDLDDDDDPNMESNFAQQQREEYISKKHGILEDLEDMRMEALEKKKKGKSKRRLSDD